MLSLLVLVDGYVVDFIMSSGVAITKAISSMATATVVLAASMASY